MRDVVLKAAGGKGLIKNGMKVAGVMIQNGASGKRTKLLLTLHQRKGLDVARAGAPSVFSGSKNRR